MVNVDSVVWLVFIRSVVDVYFVVENTVEVVDQVDDFVDEVDGFFIVCFRVEYTVDGVDNVDEFFAVQTGVVKVFVNPGLDVFSFVDFSGVDVAL